MCAVREPVGQRVSGWERESSVSGYRLEWGKRQLEDDWVNWRMNLSAWVSMSTH